MGDRASSDRHKFIDQAQSINVFFRPDANIKYLHAVHFLAWKSGLKTLYYCISHFMRYSIVTFYIYVEQTKSI